MFNSLNDDCQLYILQYLDLPSQLVLKRASEHWVPNIHYYWRRQRKVTLSDHFKEFKSEEDLNEFLEQICGTLVELNLGRLHLKRLQAWLPFAFPNVRTLNWQRCWSKDDNDGQDGDEHVRLLSELFPALNKLELSSDTTGKHLWSLGNLTDLCLSCCAELDAGQFEQIFCTLKLKKLSLLYFGYNTVLDQRIEAISKCDTLEELEIDDHHLLYDLLGLLLELPKFRKLSCYTRDYHEYVIDKLARLRGADVRSVLFHDVFWSSDRLLGALLLMPQLRRAIFNADDMDAEHLYQLTLNLRHLEQFHFTRSRQVFDVEILNLFANCRNLAIADISGTLISGEFVMLHQTELCSALKSRKKPLKLHCSDCGFNEFQLNLLFPHQMVEVCMQPVKVDMPSPRFFQIELEPLIAST